jgi:hypothetical protein
VPMRCAACWRRWMNSANRGSTQTYRNCIVKPCEEPPSH